jgi:hypothetical protein
MPLFHQIFGQNTSPSEYAMPLMISVISFTYGGDKENSRNIQ